MRGSTGERTTASPQEGGADRMAARVGDIETTRPGDGVPLEVHLVPMRRRHLRAVLRIETQVYPRPWSLPLFMSELNLRTSRAYYVARVDGNVVGYAGLM